MSWRTVARRVPPLRWSIRRARAIEARLRGWRDGDPDATRADGSAVLADTPIGRLFDNHRGRLVDKWDHYLDAYEQHFAPFRNGFPLPGGTTRPLRILEIGVFHGGSLQLWRTYFGPQATIFGIDIEPRCATLDGDDAHVRIGSQDDPDFLRAVVAEMGGVDIVIDDGSHHARHLRASFDTLYPLLSEGGIYAAEDLHTAYWPHYRGGRGRPGTFVEFAKSLVDDVNHWAHGGRRTALTDEHGASQISFHDSMVFITKARQTVPLRIVRGTPSF